MEVALRVSDEDPTDEAKLNSMKEASVSLDNVRMKHVIMLKQKSRNKWLVEGVSNTAFFHANIQTRRSNNVISELVDENEEGVVMDAIPSLEEIKVVVFDLGVDSAPGPDGFSGCFYRHCWDVIQQDLFSAILATRLGGVLDRLVSEKQVSFMQGSNIHENISVASEIVNELKSKRKDGNVGLKLDISQAFDTVSWSFVLEVFRRYGFSENWCSWILNILSSARVSVLINGSPEGFFSINRGLRQGDPSSPLIFVLIEDVLSRNLTKLFLNKSVTPMLSKKGISPTHLFFVDDVMIFCEGNMKSFHSLLDLLGKYQASSGQTVSRQKSKVYYGGNSLSRCRTIMDLLGMEVSNFSDRYLGVQIMPGDAEVCRKVVIAYDKVCSPVREGGLGITKLVLTNKALLMKLWWNIQTSKKKWARFLYAKYTNRRDRTKKYEVNSSILSGIKQVYREVK
ncbi:uncharacterized protein LOC113295670 [Papaver somniferum]|uniref:uncharacterized protein LOC113295670 n=1 Tax=Papaver somniferum TaxID=3469 RepID=UPI000E6FACBD|nr:uncharacterized protein LOC113295670 [Papaver somniferum]